MRRTNLLSRAVGAGLVLALTAGLVVPAAAAEPSPACSETYYATLDYYGGLKQSSVVKTYHTAGCGAVVDYGDYEKITDLTDGREACVSGSQVRFDLNGEDTFCFEGATPLPYQTFPWTLSLSYTLNGVPTPAEELGGKTGVVEITLDAVPNQAASDYSRNNLVLTAASMFNGEDILSLEAPGAQVHLIGNLYCVLYMVMPGETQRFTIRVGSNAFSYSGMTFLAVPATLGQLDQITELRTAKEDAEDAYSALSGSLDTILDSLDGMSGSLNQAANGIDQLNRASGTLSGGKNRVYDSLDTALDTAGSLTDALQPVAGHLDNAAEALGDLTELLDNMGDALSDLRPEAERARRILRALRDDLDGLQEVLDDAAAPVETLMERHKKLLDDAAELVDSMNRLETILNVLRSHGKALDSQLSRLGDDDTLERPTAAELETLVDAVEGAVDPILERLEELCADVQNSVVRGLEQLSSNVQRRLDTLEKDRDILSGSLSDVDDAATLAIRITRSLDRILEQSDSLLALLDEHESGAQEAPKDAGALVRSAAGSLSALTDAARATQALARESGSQLDAGTRAALSGVSASLRQSTKGLSQTDTIRDAKDTIDALITDQWDSHTGGDNNLLLIDAAARPESLTDSRNQNVESIQYVIRTQEIKAREETAAPGPAARQEDAGTFWSRVADMFRDFWKALTGIFQ